MPRKSTASISAAPTSPTTAPAGDTSTLSNATEPKSPTAKSSKKKDDDSVGIDDLLLPRSLTSRISRGILPPNTSLQKDAVLALTKSATVFISYLASTANELTSRKTISPQDVMKAIHECELDRVMGIGEVGTDGVRGGRLERELEVFESVVRGKRKGYREKVKMREGKDGNVEGEGDGEEGREKKRVRRMSDDNAEDEDELLDAQLNGPVDETGSGSGPDYGITGGRFGAAGVDEETREPDYGAIGGRFGAAGMEEDNDETEDDPEIEDEEDDDAPDDEEDEQEPNDEAQDRIDVDEGGGRSRLMLAPNGRAEVGSEDESD